MRDEPAFDHDIPIGDPFAPLPSGLGGAEPVPAPPSLDRAPIRLLPASVAARIAAGEVVERPASVVKELVENALDAGARRVRVDVRNGGLDLIRVTDDGCGIPPDELWLACQRHATSKLSTTVAAGDGLDRLSTLGFRGEALPSIAAVAELTITSAHNNAGIGHRVALDTGRVVINRPAPRPRGTTVAVRGLFANVPARLAAVARSQTEIAQIALIARRLAIAAPAVAIELVVDDRATVRTSGSGSPHAAMVELYGGAVGPTLMSLGPTQLAHAHLSGIIAGPELTRSGRDAVHLIVNGRWVQPRALLHQIEAAYRPLLPRGRHPLLVLAVAIDADRVDVNVHPTKLEVRLRDERAIGQALGELVRGALARRPVPLSGDFAVGAAALAWPSAGHRIAEDAPPWEDEAPIVTPGLPPLRLVGQVQSRLVLLEGPAGIYLVDQHRAHERILYERLHAIHQPTATAPASIDLPDPLLIELRPAQVARFGRRLDELAALGFTCEVFGGRTFLVRAVPALPGVVAAPADALALPEIGEAEALAGSLLALADEQLDDGDDWRETLLVRLACRSAVRRGRTLDRPAMRALIDGLGRTGAPAVCPHGSPLLMRVDDDLLTRQFDW